MRATHEDIVDGWRIAATADGGFGVFDEHGMLAGPFGCREQAIAAALKLPRPERRPADMGPAPALTGFRR
ncbi:MAG TPA: hypothetical protein VHB74_14420 [Devosia sp.]|jgi:hypothetical protein|nr:hypothetical protein [Devosia sp.]